MNSRYNPHYQYDYSYSSVPPPPPISSSTSLIFALAAILLSSILISGLVSNTLNLGYYLEFIFGDSYWIVKDRIMNWSKKVDWNQFSKGLVIDTADQDDEIDENDSGFASSSFQSSYSSSMAMIQKIGDPDGTMYPGLLNAGNLCFLNATLQSIASIPPLLTYLESLPSTSTTPVITNLLQTLHALNSPCSSRPPPLRPLDLAHAIANSSPTRRRLLSSRDQQDAHELLGIVRESVEEEVNKNRLLSLKRRRRIGFILNPTSDGDEGRGEGNGVWDLRDPWVLLISQKIKCMSCGYTRDVRHTMDQQVELQVPLVTHCSIYDLLDDYTKMDLLSDYACRKCCLTSTLQKLEGQRDRLALVQPSPSAPATRSQISNAFESLVDVPTDVTPTPTMTASRKDRRRKVQKLLDKVKEACDAGDFEKDFGEEIKIDKVFGPAGKIVRFARNPDILTFHLSRSAHFSTGGGVAFKNPCRVEFPEYLDLSPFTDHPPPPTSLSANPSSEGLKEMYRLCSLVVHYGTHSFGHYVAYRRRPPLPPHLATLPRMSTPSDYDDEKGRAKGEDDGERRFAEWYRISDETVEEASIDEVLRGNPFLLFYEKVLIDLNTAKVVDSKKVGMGLAETKEGMMVPRVLKRWQLANQMPIASNEE